MTFRHWSEEKDNNLIFKFPVNLEVAFESYASFTVLHLLHRPLSCLFFMMTLKNSQFGNYLAKQMKLQEIFCTRKLCTQRLLQNVKI